MLEVTLPYEGECVSDVADRRSHLPESWLRIGIPGEYKLHYRLIAIDPLEQRSTAEMRILLFKDGHVTAEELLKPGIMPESCDRW